jgi:Carboxypeptidase regulatory-like domain
MDISVGEPKPLVQYQVRQRRMRVLPAAAQEQFHGCERGRGRYINDGDLVVHRRKPPVAGHQNRAKCQQHDGYSGLTSEVSQNRKLGCAGISLDWISDQVVRMLLRINRSVKCGSYSLDFDLLRFPRIPARCWYHVWGTIFGAWLNQKGKKASKLITVNPAKMYSNQEVSRARLRASLSGRARLLWLGVSLLLCCVPALAQRQQTPAALPAPNISPATPEPAASIPEQLNQQPNQQEIQQPNQQSSQQADPQLPGNISGTVVDPSGAAVAGAHIVLTRDDKSPKQEVLSGDDGQFSFAGVPPGPFQITVNSELLTTQKVTAILHAGEILVLPQIVFALATELTQVNVVVPRVEIAEEELKVEEKQRIFGVIPNFYVSYIPNAAPLASKQKFELAWRSTIDPVNFAITGAIAGVQQATNTPSGYGQGAQGYAKRYGASYADLVTGTFIGGAILPSLLKQDPRYFYKGTGSVHSRVLYAIANSVICKGDNGHWQPNYSSILGSLAAGGISNLYYPAQNRNGAGLTFENALIGIGETAATNLLQEFVVRKLTPNLSHQQSATP